MVLRKGVSFKLKIVDGDESFECNGKDHYALSICLLIYRPGSVQSSHIKFNRIEYYKPVSDNYFRCER